MLIFTLRSVKFAAFPSRHRNTDLHLSFSSPIVAASSAAAVPSSSSRVLLPRVMLLSLPPHLGLLLPQVLLLSFLLAHLELLATRNTQKTQCLE